MAAYSTDDVRIKELKELVPPAYLMQDFPCEEAESDLIFHTRQAVHRILHGLDDRLIVIIGPCSIHDPEAALEYARRLAKERERLRGELEIVMRVYFEKPRTTLGWKGLINDPYLDNSFKINDGLRIARQLLLQINTLQVPAGTEFLDMISPQYLADLVSWGAIGARTTESQVHRELASGLSCPIGFKNGTEGSIKIAIDAVKAAAHPHHFLSVTKNGHSAIVSTVGNPDGHVILRGGKKPNYDAASIEAACAEIRQAHLSARLIVDASHANSNKNHKNQISVCQNIGEQLAAGEERIVGVMVESHLVEGRQDLKEGHAEQLVYGQSITDACLGWPDSVTTLDTLAQGVRERRKARKAGQE